jgi:hypothetical protein
MMSQVVDTCSICGGAVMVPLMWMSGIPPVPTCGGCGAVAAAHGPVIPMRRQEYSVTTGTSTALPTEPSKS